MHSPVVRGLCFMFVNALLYLPAQGQLQRATPHPSILLPAPTCCLRASKYSVTEPVKACYEQKENTLRNCKIHAYIFICETQQYCVDPSAKWLPEKLKVLEEEGINCTALAKAPSRHGAQIF
uniref:Chemokine interleukin-8-like domain-containing protein n=1 Tax=Sparus aurata TaxID=8175 RepID=A0A671YA40_SPAAU